MDAAAVIGMTKRLIQRTMKMSNKEKRDMSGVPREPRRPSNDLKKGQMVSSSEDKSDESQFEKYPRKTIQCEDGKTAEERGRRYAELLTGPELAAYRAIHVAEQKSGVEKEIDVPTLIEALRDQGKAVNRGDLAQAEAMLMNQATALQSLFARLTEKAFSVTHLPHFDSFMRMALRAQNQCRATLETLSAIKNPPVVIAKQANIAQGPQQINNGTTNTPAPARAEENKIQQNKLLPEVKHGATMDIRATSTAITNDPAMETVGKINRTEYTGG